MTLPLHGQAAVDQLLEVLDLKQVDQATFIGESPQTGAQRVFGGQVAGQALVAFSQTGDTVRRLSRLHCELPLLAFTPVPEVRDQLALSWGVETFLTDFVQHTDDMFRQVDGKMLGLGLAKPGDYVVVVAGSPPNAPGSTNTLRVHQLGSLVDPATV